MFRTLPTRIVTQTGKFDHITSVLFDLHWLPVSYHIVFKFFIIIFFYTNDSWFCFSQCDSDLTQSNNFARSMCVARG